MRLQNIEQKITRTGVISLAALAIIGIIACFTGAFDIDMSIFSRTLIEDIFIFILGTLSILVGFCFPVSFLMNISKLAFALVEANMLKKGISALSMICLLVSVLILSNIRPADISSKAQELNAYCIDNGYNADYGILIDYGRHSFQKRLFVYDFNNEKVILKSLCAHGSGGESTVFRGDFSNNPGSHCSSLGHYRVGRSRNMYNRRVPAVEVHGLDNSNSNALSRGILIHPTVGPLTWGCFGMPVFRYHELSEWLKTMPKSGSFVKRSSKA